MGAYRLRYARGSGRCCCYPKIINTKVAGSRAIGRSSSVHDQRVLASGGGRRCFGSGTRPRRWRGIRHCRFFEHHGAGGRPRRRHLIRQGRGRLARPERNQHGLPARRGRLRPVVGITEIVMSRQAYRRPGDEQSCRARTRGCADGRRQSGGSWQRHRDGAVIGGAKKVGSLC